MGISLNIQSISCVLALKNKSLNIYFVLFRNLASGRHKKTHRKHKRKHQKEIVATTSDSEDNSGSIGEPNAAPCGDMLAARVPVSDDSSVAHADSSVAPASSQQSEPEKQVSRHVLQRFSWFVNSKALKLDMMNTIEFVGI